MESETDIFNPFGKKKSNSTMDSTGAGPLRPVEFPPLDFDASTWRYDLTGDKVLHVFNHYKYQSKYFRKLPPKRDGTYKDVSALAQVFKARGFQVIPHHDYTRDQILEAVTKLSRADHSKTSCVALAVLTHGEGNEVLAADRPYDLKDLYNLFAYGDKGLVGKPKIFIVQACRGKQLDPGREVQFDSGPEGVVLPAYADFLTIRSSVEDFVSWRDSDGSWMVQTLCRVLTYKEYLDLARAATLAAHIIATERSSNTPSEPEFHGMKQAMETCSTLTKPLFLEVNNPASGESTTELD